MNPLKYKRNCILFIFMTYVLGAAVCFSQIVETVDVNETLFSVEPNSKNMVIISKSDIEELKIENMGDLFSFYTAVNVSKRSGSDSSFDIGMRGSNFEEVLVLVNGVRVNNPQTGHFNSDFPFSVKDIERVEIIRGGSSTIYGPGAFAGVINIVLRNDTDFKVTSLLGQNKFFSTSVGVGKKLGDFWLRISADREISDGYYKNREFSHWKFSASAGYEKEKSHLDLDSGYVKKDFGADGFYAPYPSFEKINSFFSRIQFEQKFYPFSLMLSYAYDSHGDNFTLDRNRPQFFQNESDTRTHHGAVHLSFTDKTGKWNGGAGVEYNSEKMESLNMGNRERQTGALFANVEYGFFPGWGLDLGVRETFLEFGKSNTTWYMGLFHRINGELVIRGGYGKSFRLPSFTELYYNSPGNIGNAMLMPETSRNLELSLTWTKNTYITDISIFYRNQNNLLDWVKFSTDPGESWQSVNIEKNDLLGFEWTQQLRLNRTLLIMGIEKIVSVNEQAGFTSKYGLRFPDFSIKTNIVQRIGREMNLALNYMYKRLYRTEEKGHFVNATISVPIGRVEISLRAENLLNTIIEEIPGVKIPGRWIYMGFTYR